ncbi:hypothetical protein GHT06_018946 [Daphnia sinensis]|uniref:Uncharacterized protein n=1 Tax=Daphnia sinensis TaxID=1820382 RepID=A0AAD5KPM2_9CRUS|nr:hypothetical protein GHT06_018946 [Daphnia sinensis]
MCKFSNRIISVKWEDPKAARNGRISVVLIVSSLWMLLLLITLAFHLNQHPHLDNDPTEPMLLERQPSNISMKLCNKEDEIKLQIFHTNFQLFNVTKEESTMLQTSLPQLIEQFSKDFMAAKMSVGQVEFLAKKLNQQSEYVNRCLDQYGNSADLYKVIQEPLKTVSELTKKIAQLYFSITSRFEELFRLVKHVVGSSKKMGRLEGALSIINRQINTSVYKRMELDLAMESLKNISVELDLRLERDQAELKTVSYQWQWLQEKRNSAHCFANWEWNWWPFTYTTTSVCYGRPSDEDWANTKARFEQALWRSNCSAQAVGNLHEKMEKWDELDAEISKTIEMLEMNKLKLEQDMGLLNGTKGESFVPLKRETCKMTRELKYLYSDAGEFFLNASSRYADSLAVLKAESLGKLSDSASTSLFDDPFLEWKNNMRKTIEEVQEEESKYATASTFIFGRKGISHFVKQLKKMTKRKTTNAVNLLKLLATARSSLNLGYKKSDRNLQMCDTITADD